MNTNFPPGTRVWYWNARAQVQYGTVTGVNVMPDRTQILTIRDDGGTTINLPTV
ncbi:hypothetical protein K435DRAFT_772275, partial [Dendrothele bispora CBS 962.96]